MPNQNQWITKSFFLIQRFQEIAKKAEARKPCVAELVNKHNTDCRETVSKYTFNVNLCNFCL